MMNDDPSTKTVRSFEDLDCYQAARKFRKEIAVICKFFSRDEDYRLKDQIIRSSRSVTANLAEGYGRHHHQENLQFARQARGSLTETLDHLNTALDEGQLKEDEYSRLRDQWETCLKILNGYINYISRCARSPKPV